MDARRVAFEVLLNIITDEAYSNNALTKAFTACELSAVDMALVTEIVYGTLTHYQLLDYQLTPFFRGRVKKWVLVLLAMTLYQVRYLTKIPNYAAVDAAVKLAKLRGGDFNAKMVNAILRNVTTAKLRCVEEIADEATRLATKYSHPEWVVRLWIAQFGKACTVAMLTANNKRAKLAIRTNLTKITTAALSEKLLSEGVVCLKSALYQEALVVSKQNPLQTPAFKDGLFYVQDEASMLPALALAPAEGARVLDVCAAPGGKACHLAQLVGASGVVLAHDLLAPKLARLEENAKRLGINNIKASVCSALELDKLYELASFDYILVDAPCLGLGILRRHPEAKLFKTPTDLDEILKLQQAILQSASKFLKPGGRLIYSTCTVNKKENQRQVENFLKTHPDFALDLQLARRLPAIFKDKCEAGMLQLFPQDFETDGFFIASITRQSQ